MPSPGLITFSHRMSRVGQALHVRVSRTVRDSLPPIVPSAAFDSQLSTLDLLDFPAAFDRFEHGDLVGELEFGTYGDPHSYSSYFHTERLE